MLVTALAAATFLLAQQATTPTGTEADRLAACLTAIEADPVTAYEDALAWMYQGNRPAARYCHALTLLANDRPEDGAAKLEQLANARDGGTLEERAIYLTQAGHGWLQASAPDAAVVAFTSALKLKANDPALLTDRASAHLLTENTDGAMADLNAALKAQAGFGPAHQLRAQLNLEAGKLDAALADVKAAMAAEPDNVDTLVLRGHVREAMRLAEAKKSG